MSVTDRCIEFQVSFFFFLHKQWMWMFLFIYLFLFFGMWEKQMQTLWPHTASIRRCHHWGRFPTNQVPLFCCDRRGWRRLRANITTSIHFRRAALTSPKKEMKHVGGNCESSGRGYLAVFHRSWASRNGYWGGGKHNTTRPVPQLLSVKEHDCTRWPLQHSNWRLRT